MRPPGDQMAPAHPVDPIFQHAPDTLSSTAAAPRIAGQGVQLGQDAKEAPFPPGADPDGLEKGKPFPCTQDAASGIETVRAPVVLACRGFSPAPS